MNSFSLGEKETLQWWIGFALFFLVPIVLWIVGSLISRTAHGWEATFAFVTGGKNRLSLSRSQAFAWTLIIFGSFVSAMVMHNPIRAGTAEEIKQAEEDEKKLAAQIAVVSDDLNKKRADLATKSMATLIATDATRVDATNKEAEAKALVEASEATLKDMMDKYATINPYLWVLIPPTLLALAGIAISSGVFSSVISVVSGDAKDADVSSISLANIVAPSPAGAILAAGQVAGTDKLMPFIGQQLLTISGDNFGDKGKVRLVNSKRSEVIFDAAIAWQNQSIQVVIPDGTWTTLIVDTADNKLCYELNGAQLGAAKAYFELADLFRDDKDPTKYDLMKFQMFGWTIIAIGFYSWNFLANLRPDLRSLPVVPESIVLLTGLSQAGYLGGKAVSNIPK